MIMRYTHASSLSICICDFAIYSISDLTCSIIGQSVGLTFVADVCGYFYLGLATLFMEMNDQLCVI